MSRPANTTLIGGFVMGAVTLMIAGLLFFGKGGYGLYVEYVLYFDENLSGLDIGAPVEYEGVRVGYVSDIKLLIDVNDYSMHLQVTARIEPDRVSLFGDYPGRKAKTPDEFISIIIERGLRAQLKTESIVTGKLKVDLAFHPGAPLVWRDFTNKKEMPTIPSPGDMITSKFTNLRIEELIENSISAVSAIERIVESEELQKTLASMETSAEQMSLLVVELKNNLDPAFLQLDKTMKRIEFVAGNVDVEFKTVSGDFAKAMSSAREAFDRVQNAAIGVDGIVAKDSPIRYELATSLRELSAAAHSIRVMSDYLARHPEALVHGKGSSRKR